MSFIQKLTHHYQLFSFQKKMRRGMISQAATVRWCNVPWAWCFLPSLMWTVQQFHWLQHKTRAGVRGSSHVLCCSPRPSHRSPSALPLLLPCCKIKDREAHTERKGEKMRVCIWEGEKERKNASMPWTPHPSQTLKIAFLFYLVSE